MPPVSPSPMMPPSEPPVSPDPMTPPSMPPMEPSPPSAPPMEPAPSPPAPAQCGCDAYKQGASDDRFLCSKKERGEEVCVPAIWVGKKKPKKYEDSEAMTMYKCGASDFKLCALELWSPSPPVSPPFVLSPMPPSRPSETWKPSPPPLGPSAVVVPCVNKAKDDYCTKKMQKNKCHLKKMQKKCQLSCGAVCVQSY